MAWAIRCSSSAATAGSRRLNFRIRKGTHVSHFHERCAGWPSEDFYEQDKPLWWGNLCEECSRLADQEKRGQAPFSRSDAKLDEKGA
jgi:hypothetical protein